MPSSYRVRLTKDYLTFCSAHFVTFQGDICEPLHGHNFRVTAELDGPLDRDYFVVDFITALEILRELVKELDHHVLLPTKHALIQVTADDTSVEAVFRDRRWVFPRTDCVLLPVENTSSELLAQYLGERLLQALPERLGFQPTRLSLEVDECQGQSAVYIWTP
jgi:6-pyruvoyltetrahydropterin/6-carboxytetrahydropterin synthase